MKYYVCNPTLIGIVISCKLQIEIMKLKLKKTNLKLSTAYLLPP